MPGNRDSQCLRPAHAARAREAPACRRAREVTLHLTLCFWFYSHKAFLGANIFFCRRFEWREVSISVWQYFSCCSLLPPYLSSPLSSFVYECAQKRTTILKETIINLCMLLHKGSCSSFVIAELLLLIELCGMVMFWNSDSKYLKIMDLQTHSVSHILR